MMIPEPDAPAPYTDASRARLAVSVAAAELADSVRGFVPISQRQLRPTGGGGTNGAEVEDVARIVAAAERLLELAVTAEIVGGTTWEEVGEALEMARQSAHKKYAHDVKAFQSALADGIWVPEGADSPDEWGPRLDAWVRRRHQVGDVGHGEHPVSGALARLDPHIEIMRLDRARMDLMKEHFVPPVDDLQRIAERQLVLWQRMADDPERLESERRIAAEAVDVTRARLDELAQRKPAERQGGA